VISETVRYDPFDADVQADPYPTYRLLREQQPLYWAAASHSWVLSRHPDVRAALDDPGTFCSAQGIYPTPRGVDLSAVFLPMMIMTDPPRHTQLRALVARAFTPRRVADLRASIQATCDGLLEQVSGQRHCELVADFAGPMPAMVIADLLGVPRADRDQFRTWSTLLVQARPDQGLDSPGMRAATDLYGYFASFLADRRGAPRDDLLSALVAAEIDGVRLTEQELLGFCLLLLVAGHETTSNLLGNAAVVLAQHPDARRELREQPALLAPAVQELLRYDSPVQGLSRTVTRPVTLHSRTLEPGEQVLLLFGSANRDDRAFHAPDVFDMHRSNDQQLAFGHGPHYCLGAALAQLEACIALPAMLTQLPDWQVDLAGAQRLSSGPIRGYTQLPVRW
jgi:cytochrome P450